jgi:hypothetical protein
MPKGILYVESRPKSPELTDAYHEWYENHVVEIVGLEGFVSARRFVSMDDANAFAAVYEIEADDLDEVRKRLWTSLRGQGVPDTVQTDPPSRVLFFEQISAQPS